MTINRTQNAARNIVFDGALRLLNIFIPFVMRSVILYALGVEFLGLSGLFNSILSLLNLAELGVGAAMVFSMYRPIAEDDTDTICALMGLYRKFYRLIGLFIAAAGLALTPFLPRLVQGDTPPGVSLYALYFMNLAATVLSYWLYAYKNSLLIAHQRTDVGSKITLAVNLFQYALQALVLLLFRDYYLYLALHLLAQIATNLLTARAAGRMYPLYEPRGTLPRQTVRDITQRIRDFFTSRFSAVVFNYADTIVISAFMGLTALAIYQNYFYVITALRTMLEVIIGACIAGVGNSLITEGAEKNYNDLEKFSFMFGWIVCLCSTMLLCLYQPFMYLWMGEANMLPFSCVICFTIYFYAMGINKMANMFKDAAGIWHKDRFRPLTAALVNIALNLATVQRLGLYGVLLSSVISIAAVQLPWLLHNLFDEIFPRRYLKQYALRLCTYVLLAAASCASARYVCSLLSPGPWAALFWNGCVSFVIPNALYLLCYGRSSLFRQSVQQVKKLALRKK
ncbi:MAG: polysaccharide biosynthesis protein [Oscillospiraceae bacterium]|nr:polysaccharide biosynthesis protein [Oscillospiraceae bacterium]